MSAMEPAATVVPASASPTLGSLAHHAPAVVVRADAGFPVPPGDQAQWMAAQVDSVRAATRSGQHPERLSPGIDGPAWDRAAYQRDPLAYLSVTEPSRAWKDGAEPGLPEIVLIEPAGMRRVEPGGTVAVRVQTTPYAPVSALATAGGAFDNGLASITVAADAAGVGTVLWTATPGTVAEAGVTLASPGAVGVAKVIVTVQP